MKPTPEQVERAFSLAPAQVRFFIEEGLLAEGVLRIAENIKLAEPLLVPFAKLSKNTLIGLVSPDQFSQELVAIGVPVSNIPPITVAFHEEIVKKATQLKVPDVPATLLLEKPKETSAITEKGGSEDSLKVSGLAPTEKTMSTHAQQSPSRTINKLAPEAIAPSPQLIRPRTMASDVEAIEPVNMVARPAVGNPSTPVIPPTPKAPPQKPTPTLVPNASNVQADMKKYGVDPYREPLV